MLNQMNHARIGTLGRVRRSSIVDADVERSMRIGCNDWDKRWKDDWYVCRYRIGEVEEDLKFSRTEIADAIGAATAMVRCTDIVIEGVSTLGEYISWFTDEGMNAIETYVRCKRGLPIDKEPLAQTRRRYIKPIVTTHPARRKGTQKHWWSIMLFSTMSMLRVHPVDRNCLSTVEMTAER